MALGSYLVIGAIVFAIGVFGVLTRRNVVFVFMSLEVMFGGVGLTILAFARQAGAFAQGQVFVLFVLAVAAAETALGLAIFLAVNRTHQSVHSDELTDLKG